MRKFIFPFIVLSVLAVFIGPDSLWSAVSRLKTWSSAEVLTASDLNAEFNNILNNGEGLAWPATASKDFDGEALLLDGDADTTLTSDTDDRIDLALSGNDLFRFDGTVATPVNGLDFIARATGSPASIQAQGSDSNVALDIRDDNGNELVVLSAVASAVNDVTITNAATGVAPTIGSSGESDIGWELLDSNGNEILTGGAIASAVNEITVENAVTAEAPEIQATGGDTNISIDLVPKGTGVLQLAGQDMVFARNHLINGGFRVAQRGTSFDATTTPANSDDTYLLDRWVLLSDGNDAVDVTQETSTVPTGAYAAIRLDVETANKKFGLLQVLEARDSAALIGGVASFSFKARTSGAISIDHLRAAIMCWDSTADTVTSDIISAWAVAGTNPTLVANWTNENTPASLATLTTSYQTFRIENASLDTASCANVAVFIWTDDVTTTAGEFLYLADARLEPGAVATPFERRAFEQELALSQRYYSKSFNQSVAPAQNAGTGGSIGYRASIAGVLNQGMTVNHPVTMRSAPTITFYNPSAANALWRNSNGAADSGAATADFGGQRGFIARNPQDAADNAGDLLSIHYQADAEL